MRDATSGVAEIRGAVHLCIDMQNIFAPGGLWATPWMERVLPTIVSAVSRYPERTIFTRFITPQDSEDRPGQWQSYFRRWHQATRRYLPSSALELVPAVSRFVPPAAVIDKPAYSAFSNPGLASLLVDKNVGTVVISGAETDVCVLATVMAAQRQRHPPRPAARALAPALRAPGHDRLDRGDPVVPGVTVGRAPRHRSATALLQLAHTSRAPWCGKTGER